MGLFRRKIPDFERNLSMQIIEKHITEITPYEKNPRKNDEAVEYVANSIKEFGFKVPIVIDKNGVIVAGHTRYKAAQELGLEKLPCVIADDLTEEQIKAFRIADNKTGEIATWDILSLSDELKSIESEEMTEFGYDFDDLESILNFGNVINSYISSIDNEMQINEETENTQNGITDYKPVIGKQSVNNKDIKNAEKKKDTEYKERVIAIATQAKKIICPHCGEEFEIGGAK